MQGRAGVASGLILGLGFIMGAIGVPVMGAIGDALGLQSAFRIQAIIASAAIVLSLLLPTERALERLTARKEASLI
jgi:FSR family fosmidomycin resistance protein-like MFS transporter